MSLLVFLFFNKFMSSHNESNFRVEAVKTKEKKKRKKVQNLDNKKLEDLVEAMIHTVIRAARIHNPAHHAIRKK